MDRTGESVISLPVTKIPETEKDEKLIVKELSFSSLTVRVIPIGRDYAIIVSGGTAPHIGCTVTSVPRESLKNDGSFSCTSSVYNLTGHKDEEICRFLSEALCKKTRTTVICTGGFHVDNITPDQIKEVQEAVREIAVEL